MIFRIERHCIRIIPQTEQDIAYIEDTLGLKRKGDSIKLVRCAPMGLDSAISCLETADDIPF